MIEILPESQGNILAVKGSGRLTDFDYQTVLIPQLESLIHTYGKVRFLFIMDEDFQGWDLEAAWDDATFGFRHRNDFEKVAVVGGPRWVEWCAKLSAHLLSGEIKTFPPEQVKEAWDWIQNKRSGRTGSQ